MMSNFVNLAFLWDSQNFRRVVHFDVASEGCKSFARVNKRVEDLSSVSSKRVLTAKSVSLNFHEDGDVILCTGLTTNCEDIF